MTKKSQRIEIRVSYLERSAIELNASKAGMTVSEYVRDSALGRLIKARRTSEELFAYQNLSNFKTNFARISNLLVVRDETLLKAEIHNLVQKLDQALNDIIQ